MPEQDRWDEFRLVLRQMMKDKAVKKLLEQNGEKIPLRTLFRWSTGETQVPKKRQLLNFLEVAQQQFPQYHEQLLEAIKKALPDFRVPLIDLSTNSIGGLPADFLVRVLETHLNTQPDLHFMTLVQQVFLQVSSYLDSEHSNLELCLLTCTPPQPKRAVRSVQELLTWRAGQPQISPLTTYNQKFYGMESLIGYCIGFHRAAYSADLSKEELFPLPGRSSGSAVLFPIQRAGRLAGCFLVVSSQRHGFSEQTQYILQLYTYALTLAFEPHQFYPEEHIQLRFLPDVETQLPLIHGFPERLKRLLREQPHLSPKEAEIRIWQQIEEELLDYSSKDLQERRTSYANPYKPKRAR